MFKETQSHLFYITLQNNVRKYRSNDIKRFFVNVIGHIAQIFMAFSEKLNFNNGFYLSREYKFYLLLRLTKGPRMLHYRTGPFWQQFHPFLHYNDAHIGSIGSLMIAVAAGIAALAVCLRNRALFDPPNTVMSPLSTWPRTPIPHLQQFSLVKGQSISKSLFGFFNSSKKWTKNFCPSRLG